jgi:aminoglycoside 6'-N-acetyltransferase I
MMNDIAIVAVTLGNAGLLDRIADGVFDNPVESRFLAAFLNDPRHVLLVAMQADMVVGMATGVEYFHPDKPPQLWINEVGVAEPFRCRGIGRALMAALIAVAEARGCICAWLGTEADNVAARACYAAVPRGTPPEPFLLYEWELGAQVVSA